MLKSPEQHQGYCCRIRLFQWLVCQCAGSCVYFTLQVLECSTPSNVQHFLELLIANKQNQNKQNTFLHIFPSSVSVWAPPFII